MLRLFSENIKRMARNAKKILPLAGSKMVFQKQSKGIVIMASTASRMNKAQPSDAA